MRIRIATWVLLVCACVAGCASQSSSTSTPAASRSPASQPAQGSVPGSLTPETPTAPRTPTIVQGSGAFTSPSSEPEATLPTSGDGFQLSFSDADVATVVGAILGDGLGVPFVIDPQVKGTINLQASRPLTRDELLPTLEA